MGRWQLVWMVRITVRGCIALTFTACVPAGPLFHTGHSHALALADTVNKGGELRALHGTIAMEVGTRVCDSVHDEQIIAYSSLQYWHRQRRELMLQYLVWCY